MRAFSLYCLVVLSFVASAQPKQAPPQKIGSARLSQQQFLDANLDFLAPDESVLRATQSKDLCKITIRSEDNTRMIRDNTVSVFIELQCDHDDPAYNQSIEPSANDLGIFRSQFINRLNSRLDAEMAKVNFQRPICKNLTTGTRICFYNRTGFTDGERVKAQLCQ